MSNPTLNPQTKQKTAKSAGKQALLDKLLDLKKILSSEDKVKSMGSVQNFESEEESSKSFLTTGSLDEVDSSSIKSTVITSKIDDVRDQIIGLRTVFTSPFSFELQALYADHTATHRPYQSVESMIAYAKTLAANPHTEFSHFGKYSTEMMNYSQLSLLRSFNADPEQYVALPSGSGCTGAIQKTLKILQSIGGVEKASVYLTPYEHHSNILPWVQFYQKVNVLPSNDDGDLVLDEIEECLLRDPSEVIIVSVSASSNVTSKFTKLLKLNQIIKKVRLQKKIILCADCAAYCTHKHLNLQTLDQIDFVFVSPHKNLGGSESCGVLVGRKAIIQLSKPTFPGGGTVKFVKGYSRDDIMYEDSVFARQISGTPSFLGFYRAALSFQLLKNTIGYDFIEEKEKFNTNLFVELVHKANAKFKAAGKDMHILIYGDNDFEKRGNVITLNLMHKGQLINHNLVSTLLTDLFGIQIRSGCFCAGPFGIRLLKLSEETIQQLEGQVSIGILKNKPGYCRLDLAFYFLPFQVEYLANALAMLCEYSHQLNLLYTICNDGEIQRLSFLSVKKNMFSLSSLQELKAQKPIEDKILEQDRQIILERQLRRGEEILNNPVKFLKSIRR